MRAGSLSGSLTHLTDGSSYLVGGSGVSIASGSGSGVTLSVDDSVVATVSGTTFTGVTKHNAGISGSLTQLTDGSSYLIAGPNVTITSASNGAVFVSSSYTRDLHFLAGTVASSATSGTMESVGMVYFDPAEFPQGTKSVKFTAIISPTSGTTAYMDVYDYDGIVAAPPGPVSGSVLTGSTTSYTYLSKEIVSLENASSPGIIEARMWCSPNGAGLNAICKGAKLEVKVS